MEKQQDRQPDYIERLDILKKELLEDLSGLVRIDSVKDEPEEGKPFGKGVDEALKYMLNLAEREGFVGENIDGYGGHIDYGLADAESSVGVLCHLDVVPEGSGWDREPFGGEYDDENIYGRGTADDKGPTMAAFYAMKALSDCGYVPSKKIRMILGLDEETGSSGMHYYMQKVNMPDMAIVPDAEFPLVHGEMGIMIFDIAKKFGKSVKGGCTLKKITGGTAANMVPDEAAALISRGQGSSYDDVKQLADKFSQKNGCNISTRKKGSSLEIVSHGVSAHGAQPWKGQNAITALMSFLSELTFNCDDVNDFISFYNEHIAGEFHGESLGCGLRDDISGSLILNVGMINLDNSGVSLTVNIRCPISMNDENVYAAIAPVLEKYNMGVVKSVYEPPVYFPEDDDTVQLLLQIYRRHTGDMESKPLVIGGGTYAREMKNAIAFGAQFPGEPDVMHQKNEYMNIDRLMQTARIYADALYELAVK